MHTSSKPCMRSERVTPQWLYDYFGISAPREGDAFDLAGQRFVHRGGISRSQAIQIGRAHV